MMLQLVLLTLAVIIGLALSTQELNCDRSEPGCSSDEMDSMKVTMLQKKDRLATGVGLAQKPEPVLDAEVDMIVGVSFPASGVDDGGSESTPFGEQNATVSGIVSAKGACKDATCGSECFGAVNWAMSTGIKTHPEWYPDLDGSSSFKDFQQNLYKQKLNKCDRPCDEGEEPAKESDLKHTPKVKAINTTGRPDHNGTVPYGHPKPGFEYPARDGFTLWMVEEFDEPLDLWTDPIWTYSDGGLTEGSVRFVKEGIKFENGAMILEMGEFGHPQGDRCSHAEVGYVEGKKYTSGEFRTRYNMFRYGIYEASIKAPMVMPGNKWVNGNYVATLFAYRDAKYKHWREIDIEILAGGPNQVSTNVINGNNQASWAAGTQDDRLLRVGGLNTRDGFHTYAFVWEPHQITWYIDGRNVRYYKYGKVPIPDMSTKIIMNLWIFSSGAFGGREIWNNRYPLRAEYDWLRFYKYNGEDKYPCKNMDPECLTEDDNYLAANNPCDGIAQLGQLNGQCTCEATCEAKAS